MILPQTAMPAITDIGQLSTLLVSLRHARGLSQAMVAERLGVTRQRVSHLELRPERVTAAHLFAYVNAVGGQVAIDPRDRHTQSAERTPPSTLPW